MRASLFVYLLLLTVAALCQATQSSSSGALTYPSNEDSSGLAAAEVKNIRKRRDDDKHDKEKVDKDHPAPLRDAEGYSTYGRMVAGILLMILISVGAFIFRRNLTKLCRKKQSRYQRVAMEDVAGSTA